MEFKDYSIEKKIGEGAQGIVHLAKDKRLGRNVAIKSLHSNLITNNTQKERFIQEAKTLSCMSGKFYDVVVDLRKNSKTYKKWISVTISSDNRKMLHVPKGCANSFMTLKHNTIIHYYCSQF